MNRYPILFTLGLITAAPIALLWGLFQVFLVDVYGWTGVVAVLFQLIVATIIVAVIWAAVRYDRFTVFAHRAEKQHAQWMNGDNRGLYGEYPPADLHGNFQELDIVDWFYVVHTGMTPEIRLTDHGTEA
jgi:hypothetical protein